MDELSCEEQKAVEELRTRLKKLLPINMNADILLFYRFLKARDFDVDKAESMLLKHMTWRKLYQVDTILEDFKPREFFTKCVEPTIFGFDKEGSLVIYSQSGKLELREIIRCVEFNQYDKYWTWYFEKLLRYIRQQNKISGRNVEKISLVLDLEKLTFANATYKPTAELFLNFVNVFQNNYPECMKAVYVINAPAYATIVYAVLKAVMSGVMIRKIHLFGQDGWKGKLLEAIDADVLPAFLGGSRTDPDGDPFCKSFVNHGGTIPSEYFLPDEERYFRDRPGVERMTIPKMGRREIGVDVEEAESVIRWEFYAKSKVDFGLYRKLSELEVEEVIPMSRYDTSDGTEKGAYKVRCVGKYILVFGNPYSWLTSKEVEYCIEILRKES